jgi:hypothetical protein
MNASNPRLRRLVQSAARDPLRSPLFHWLYQNHDRLAPGLAGRRVDWAPLIAAAQKAGATNRSGRQPTEHTMWRTWRNVCAVIAAEQAKVAERDNLASTSRARHPRDLPVSARPVQVSPPRMSESAVGRAAPGPSNPATPPNPSEGFRLTLDPDGTLGGRPVTHGPLLPEPDYTGMSRAERIHARLEWNMNRKKIL